MKSITILTLSALLCLGSVTINAMDKAAEGGAGSTALAATAKEHQTYKSVARITVVDYQSVQQAKADRPKVVDIAQVRNELLAAQQAQAERPQVVSIAEVKQELQAQQQRELSLIQRYPKTALLGIGTLCFICGLYFPEIRNSVTSKLSSSGTSAGQ